MARTRDGGLRREREAPDRESVGGRTSGGEVEVDPADTIDAPDQLDDLANPDESAELPQSDAAVGNSIEDVSGDAGIGAGLGPSGDDGPELSEDPLDELDDFEMPDGQVGGLDGRDDTGAGDMGSGGPMDLGFNDGLADQSAAGRLPDHQQGVLDQNRADAAQAAARGDHEKAAEIAQDTQDFLESIDAGPPKSDGSDGSPGGTPDEGSGTPDTPGQPAAPPDATGADTTGADEEPGMIMSALNWLSEAIYDRPFLGEGGSAGQSIGVIGGMTEGSMDGLEDAGTVSQEEAERAANEEIDAQDDKTGVDDRTEEDSYGDNDPWRDFTDDYFETSRGATAGGAVDPNPQDDPAVAAEYTEVEYTDTVAEYVEGEGPVVGYAIDEVPTDQGPPMPEEEFFEM